MSCSPSLRHRRPGQSMRQTKGNRRPHCRTVNLSKYARLRLFRRALPKVCSLPSTTRQRRPGQRMRHTQGSGRPCCGNFNRAKHARRLGVLRRAFPKVSSLPSMIRRRRPVQRMRHAQISGRPRVTKRNLANRAYLGALYTKLLKVCCRSPTIGFCLPLGSGS